MIPSRKRDQTWQPDRHVRPPLALLLLPIQRRYYRTNMHARSVSRRLSHIALVWLGAALYFGQNESTTTATRFLALQSCFWSAVSVLLYATDKLLSKLNGTCRRCCHRRRIPEVTLHVVAVVGGWPGAAISQQVFSHKCRKEIFRRTFLATIIGNVLFIWLFSYMIS